MILFFDTPPRLIKVRIPPQEQLKDVVIYNDTEYRVNLFINQSSLKNKYPNAYIYAIEKKYDISRILDLVNYREGLAYTGRAFLTTNKTILQAKNILIKSLGDNSNNKTITLKNGVSVRVADGWGFIKKSVTDKFNSIKLNKVKVKPENNSLSSQDLVWHKNHSQSLINELTLGAANKIKNILEEKAEGPIGEDGELVNKLKRIYTAGNVETKRFLAAPSVDDSVHFPLDTVDSNLGDIALLRAPSDKFNFYPIDSFNYSCVGKTSEFIASVEAVQYSLTGVVNGESVFLKGMLGIIDDKLFPENLSDFDIITNSRDKKLSSNWTSLEDRSNSKVNDVLSNFDGHLIIKQWFESGKIALVPEHIIDNLSGDFDGDELSVYTEKSNPELLSWIKDGFRENKNIFNNKIKKEFTPIKDIVGMDHVYIYQTKLVSFAVNTIIKVLSLPKTRLAALVNRLSLCNSTKSDYPISESERISYMMAELRCYIKEGTDIFKTLKSPQPYLLRLQDINHVINELGYSYNFVTSIKGLLYKYQDTISLKPNSRELFWREVYFNHMEKNNLGEYIFDSIPHRIIGEVISQMLTNEELADILLDRDIWRQTTGFSYLI